MFFVSDKKGIAKKELLHPISADLISGHSIEVRIPSKFCAYHWSSKSQQI